MSMNTPHVGDGDAYGRARAAVLRHLPSSASESLEPLGTGLDHAAFALGDLFVVRVVLDDDHPETPASGFVTREAALLSAVRSHVPLPIPEVAFVDVRLAALGYRLLPGRPLLDIGLEHVDNRLVAQVVGKFVGALHRMPLTSVPETVPVEDEPLAEWLVEAQSRWDTVQAAVPAGHRESVEAFLAAAPPPDPPRSALVLCHNDLGAEHILVDATSGAVTGIIDWTDAAVTDPARDLGRLLRDFGPVGFVVITAAYGPVVDDGLRARTTFLARCTLLEDLAYGIGHDAPQYSAAALTTLPAVFAQH
jgi:aminoglycoside phosphotransferase (APT) family kinase protein